MSLGLTKPLRWVRPGGSRIVRTAPLPVKAQTAVRPPTPKIAPPPRATYTTYYDPSRVIDIDRLRVVKDMRQDGSERGEVQNGDNGILGPGSTGGAFIAPPTGKSETPLYSANKLTPWLLAAAAYLILGG